ncbi:MAG TPA: hypothetical protein VFE62_28505 [Gemmataceae bacterium]|nr:hypothetical protein [Gemmataceae bacterium]
MDLPKPDVLRCFVEESCKFPALELRWNADANGAHDRTWYLPDGLSLKGPAPTRFGVTILRTGENSYQVRVLWNHLCLSWDGLTRLQIMTGSLVALLRALGTDAWDLLNQPIEANRKVA